MIQSPEEKRGNQANLLFIELSARFKFKLQKAFLTRVCLQIAFQKVSPQCDVSKIPSGLQVIRAFSSRKLFGMPIAKISQEYEIRD
jgi:hypothetical protein